MDDQKVGREDGAGVVLRAMARPAEILLFCWMPFAALKAFAPAIRNEPDEPLPKLVLYLLPMSLWFAVGATVWAAYFFWRRVRQKT
jgi:hypothetical protein